MIKTVALLPCKKKNITYAAINQVLEILSVHCDKILVDDEFPEAFKNKYGMLEYTSADRIFEMSGLVIVMGGDGSIIDAARRSASYGIPVVGINYGRLGFLAELEGRETKLLVEILNGNFRIENRMMLDVSIIRAGEKISLPYPCLNDVVLSNGPVSRLSGFDLYCDGAYIARYSADGVIVSTPTGSSAYSMSAGGPLIYQTMECICATPICPHSFTLRPVVFTGESIIEIKNALCRENSMYITVDGREHTEILPGDTVVIRKSNVVTKLVRVKDGGLVSVLHRKLSDMETETV